MKKIRSSVLAFFLGASSVAFAGTESPAGTEFPVETATQQNGLEPGGARLILKGENSHDLFSYETTYTLRSDFRDEPRLGHGDSLYNDFSYDHRFLITGKWYFRTGVEYERFDFEGTDNGLPDHLQAFYGHVVLEYVVKDHAGAAISLNPGAYFQDGITAGSFDMPWKVFVSFPLKKDKIFGVIGLGGGFNQDPIVAPGGGLIWLFTDKLRLEGVFPKPALVYNLTDDLQFRLLADLYFESFRTDDVVTPLLKLREHNAVVQYSEERIGAQASYSGFEPFKIIVGGGYTYKRDFDFFRVGVRETTDPAPYFRVSVEAKF
jgi:hypothetical protein